MNPAESIGAPDPPQTLSEALFEEFCITNRLLWERIPRNPPNETADYIVTLNGQRVVVEIKQIENNADEIAELEARGRSGGGGGTLGTRIRNEITRGSKQIWNIAKGKCPSILLLFDNRHQMFRYVFLPEEFLSAMYGSETRILRLHSDGVAKPELVGRTFGKRRKMSPTRSKHISALGLFYRNKNRGVSITLFHNRFTNVPLDCSLFSGLSVTHFGVQTANPEDFGEWQKIVQS